MSFDRVALGFLRLDVVRHVGVGPLRLRVFRPASFDTLALSSLRPRVVRHVGIEFPSPPRRSTRWHWVPFASVSFDTLGLGALCLRVIRHVGVGSLRLCHWWLAATSFSSQWPVCRLVRVAVRVCYAGVGLPRRSVVRVVVMGKILAVSPVEGVVRWRGCVEEEGGFLTSSLAGRVVWSWGASSHRYGMRRPSASSISPPGHLTICVVDWPAGSSIGSRSRRLARRVVDWFVVLLFCSLC